MPRSRLPVRRTLRAASAALAATLALGACSKIDYLPNDPIAGWSPTVVLMHRGGGDLCGPGKACWPNTLPAILQGFELAAPAGFEFGGAEVDIQISADKTLWLGHDNEVHDCSAPTTPTGGAEVGCFQDMGDQQIAALAFCDTATNAPCTDRSAPTCVQRYSTLAEVFAEIANVHPEKMISLDIKGQYCRSVGAEDAKHMANEVDRLVRAYGMYWRVLAETSQLNFLDKVESMGTPAYTFVVSLGDVDGPLGAAFERGAEGISFKWDPASEPMNASVVDGLHRQGFRIILWTIDAPEDIAAAWAARPDVIETDAPDFFQHVPGAP